MSLSLPPPLLSSSREGVWQRQAKDLPLQLHPDVPCHHHKKDKVQHEAHHCAAGGEGQSSSFSLGTLLGPTRLIKPHSHSYNHTPLTALA